MKVWKFRLGRPLADHLTTVEMPEGAVTLSVAAIGTGIFVWAVCDPTMHPVTRTFLVVGTGVAFEWAGSFVGSVVMDDGLVWHVWET